MPVMERPEERKEADPVILAEEKNLESTIKIAQEDLGIEKSETELSKDISSKYVISAQERQDSTMHTGKSGWPKYWLKRLLPEIDLLPKEIQRVLRDYKRTQSFSPSQQSIYTNYINKRVAVKRFELKKREEMAKLKMDLRAIDAEKSISPEDAKNRRAVYFDEQTQSFYTKDEGGNIGKKNISFGDLVGDYAWGIRYQPDKTVPHKIWRKVRKTLALYETRSHIEDIFNDELSQTKGISQPTSAIGIDYIENFFKEKGPGMGGTIAERMITEFLTRAQYNNPELGMKVEHSNALEDTVLKYDFKVVIDKRRGIALESEDQSREEFIKDKRRVGIQFTIDSRPETEKKKLEQISKAKTQLSDFEKEVKRKVDDIVFVKMPGLSIFSGLYLQWLQEGKPSGGPEQYLSREQKLEIFKQATQGLLDLSEEELQKLKI